MDPEPVPNSGHALFFGGFKMPTKIKKSQINRNKGFSIFLLVDEKIRIRSIQTIMDMGPGGPKLTNPEHSNENVLYHGT